MLRRWTLGLGLAIGALAATAGPAAAGGWWSGIDLEEDHLVIGQEVRAGTEFLFTSVPEAERARADGVFHAYLLRDYDWSPLEEAMRLPDRGSWWSLGEAEAILLGPVELSGWDGNLARASASFQVPDLAPGRYALMFCTKGCAQPLGDLIPSEVTLVADPETASLAGRLDRLDERAYELEQRLQTERFNSNYAKSAALDATSAVRHLRTEMAELRAAVDGLEPVSAGSGWTSVGWFVAGAAVATLAVLLALTLKRTRRSAPVLLGPAPVHEPVAAEPSSPNGARVLAGK